MTTVIYLPDGTKNLSRLFDINWLNVEGYTVQAIDSIGVIVATTPLMVLHNCNCIRIHFLTYMGCFDAVDFRIVQKIHEPKSNTYQKPQAYPLDKTAHSTGRTDIEANDSYTVETLDYNETQMQWLDELADTPLAFIEWKGGQGQPASYLPIVISDFKKVNRKEDKRFVYQLTVDFTMSNKRITMRE